MLDPTRFIRQVKENGFSFFSGVPCSYLKDMINSAIDDGDYIMAANEGDAVAICAGAYLAGRKPVVLMQNSGLTNAISPLTSLNSTFRIPVLGFVSLRGEVNTRDEPQHDLMGKITIPLLELMGIPWEFLSDKSDEAGEQLNRAAACIEQGNTFFFIVRKNTFSPYPVPLQEKAGPGIRKKVVRSKADTLPLRIDALRTINARKDTGTFLITTTGYTSRELSEMENTKNHFPMIGSMGCAASIGLGLSLAKPERLFITVDGDGALLMRLGSMATLGYYHPKNLLHILLDNNSYESTGGQKTTSDGVDFVAIASSCGYQNSVYVHTLEELSDQISAWKQDPELTFIHLKIQPGTKENLGRPALTPPQMRERFMEHLLQNYGGMMENR
jgi:phosphonopyruvate decarboxylase